MLIRAEREAGAVARVGRVGALLIGLCVAGVLFIAAAADGGPAGPGAQPAPAAAARLRLPPGVPTNPLPSPVRTGVPVTPTPEATPGPCDPSWRAVALPAVPPGSWLKGLAATSAADMWAVGVDNLHSFHYPTPVPTIGPDALIEHWDGRDWRVVTAATTGPGQTTLTGLAALSARDIWAVGGYVNPQGTQQTLAEHWDGRQWQVVPSPNADPERNYLSGVASTAARDVWAVGAAGKAPLVLHWNGQAWSALHDPGVPGVGSLFAITALAPDDVWAVGESGFHALLLHWDGQHWKLSPAPAIDFPAHLYGVAGRANDLWAVGYAENGNGAEPLLLHWDGTRWNHVPGAYGGGPSWGGRLFGVAMRHPDDVWAVGQDFDNGRGDRAWSEHWDGHAWHAVDTRANLGGLSDGLLGVTLTDGTDLWAVGTWNTGQTQAVALRYFDPCAARTPTALPHRAPPTAAPTAEPTATASPAPAASDTPAPRPGPSPPAALAPVADPQDSAVRYFPAVGHSLRGLFRAYWEQHGGLAQFGYPLSEEFSLPNAAAGRVYTVQYFARARFEQHPEYAGTPAEVLLGRLGQELTAGRRQEAPFAPHLDGAPLPPDTAPTGYRIAPEFAATWTAQGGVPIAGYPIGAAFREPSPTDGQVYLVQYFERARYEDHPELPAPFRVSLGLLGVETLHALSWLP